jgi:hypothetical protein
MKFFRAICYLVLFIPVLVACGQAPTPAPIYKTLSESTLKPGSAVPLPKDPVVLTINGKIGQTNSGDTLKFDMATLESLGVVQYEVEDPFAKKKMVYSGVLLSQLLKVAGAAPDATTLTLWALDDYSTDMQIATANKWPVMIATQADGAYMPVDKSGPLISVFPFDDFPEIDHLTYDGQWLWSLARITVK